MGSDPHEHKWEVSAREILELLKKWPINSQCSISIPSAFISHTAQRHHLYLDKYI